MTLFTDLEKDVMAFNATVQRPPQVSEIFELMCNLIELKLNQFEKKINEVQED